MVYYPSHMSGWCVYIYIYNGILYTGYMDNIIVEYYIMWVKQCHKPPMTGNGNHTTYLW